MPAPTDQDFNAKGASLTVDYAPTSHVLVRVEGRMLNARAALFQRRNAVLSDYYGNATASVAFSF